MAGSSPDPSGVTPAAPPAADPTPANPGVDLGDPAASPAAPTAQDSAAPQESLKDHLVKALDPAPAKPTDAAPETPPKADPAQPPAEEPAKPVVKSDAEQAADDANLPFNKHPRWKEVYGENRQLKAEVPKLREENEHLKPRAAEFDKITAFMDQHGIEPEEMQGMMGLLALTKSDPEKGLAALRKMIAPLEAHLGEGALPEDLQREVNEGAITEARARELVRERSMRQHTAANASTAEQRRQQEAFQRAMSDMQDAVTTWEAQIRSQDPDYAKIQRWVVLELKALQAAKPARNPQEAVALAKEAYDTVRARAKDMMGLPRTETPRSPKATDTPAATGHRPEPGSMVDVVRHTLNGN